MAWDISSATIIMIHKFIMTFAVLNETNIMPVKVSDQLRPFNNSSFALTIKY